jgi:hypothetical protein
MDRAVLPRVVALALALGVAAGCQDAPAYNLSVTMPLTNDGGVFSAQLKDGTSNLTLFPCDVSIRLGQCKDARPVQLVIVPAAESQSGTTGCGQDSARAILTAGSGKTLQLGRSDGGVVWIQAFHGDDDDGSGLVDRPEMNAYAEFTAGTLTVTRFDGETLDAVVDATDPVRTGTLGGTLGAVDGDASGQLGVGPRCTWPIGAQAD